MKPIQYQISGGLSEADMDRIWEGALRLIQRIGLEVPHAGMKGLLSNYAGVEITGDVVTFSQDLVDEAIAAQDYSHFPAQHSSTNPAVVGGAYVKWILDHRTGEVRLATLKDLVEITKLCDAFNVYGPPCLRPDDIPIAMQQVAMYRTCYEYSRVHAHGAMEVAGWLAPREARYGKEMADVAGKDFRADLWLASPFIAPVHNLDIIWEFRNDPVDMYVATIPVAGTTAPINMIDAYVQCLAENFAGLTIVHLVNKSRSKRARVGLGPDDALCVNPFDMRYAQFVYGSAEDVIHTFYQAQFCKRFGVPLVAKSLLTMGKRPDAQAGAEKSAFVLAATMAGARGHINAGLLSVDEIYSAQQLMIDVEIAAYAARVARGDVFDESLATLSDIESVAHTGGSFLDRDSTLDHYREVLWDPSIFIHTSMAQYDNGGQKGPAVLAAEIADKAIREHTYTADEPVRRELGRIYDAAYRELVGENA